MVRPAGLSEWHQTIRQGAPEALVVELSNAPHFAETPVYKRLTHSTPSIKLGRRRRRVLLAVSRYHCSGTGNVATGPRVKVTSATRYTSVCESCECPSVLRAAC